MAAIEYQVFCRYFNTEINKSVKNITKNTWVSAFEVAPSGIKQSNLSEEVFEFFDESKYVTREEDSESAIEAKRLARSKKLQELQDYIIAGNTTSNPKFDMLFCYAGRDVMYSNTDGSYPYVLTDKMERILLSPWFIHSTHRSLSSAMEKTKKLVKLLGHDNVKLGKSVPLEQYIEIV